MISNERNSGIEFDFIIRKNLYKINKYPENYFKVIFDIGANIGLFSVFIRMRHPDSKIIVVEPCIETCRYLRQNINRLDIFLEEKALGSKSPLYLEKGRRGKHEILGHIFSEESKYSDTYRVESITLEQLADKYDLKEPYAIKVNCEGGEKHLLEDTSSHPILKRADFIGVMVHYKNKRNKSYSQSWLTLEEYESFFNNLLGQTHYIERHHDNRHGTSVYSIYKDRRFADG